MARRLSRVFISYRRSDSKDVAARIADNLSLVAEIDHVFLDVDAIAHGENFPDRLETEIKAADVVLAIIGQGWKGAINEEGRARIFLEDDFVRKEIESALRANKRLIPCLVDDALMPGAQELPTSIEELAARNAISLRHTSFHIDIEILTDSILQRQRMRRSSPLKTLSGAAFWCGGGILLAALVAIVIAWTGVQVLQMPLETILGGRTMLVVFLIVLFAGFQYGTVRFLRRRA